MLINKDITSADQLPWLAAAQAQLRRTRAGGRMPHGLLIQAVPGLGTELLAHWIATLMMCDSTGDAPPCGTCKSCRLIAVDNHPDLAWVAREEDAKQLQVDQIRALCGTFALKSYAGGYKIAVIPEADLMNANAANALLKTLEEPPPSTLLVLCSARPSRLPATIVSRCQRLKVFKPDRTLALEWLNTRQPGKQWAEILEYAAGAPLRALELEESGFAELDRDMRATLSGLRERTLDIPGTAERWSKAGLASRLDWFETWIARSVRGVLAPAAGSPPAHLPSKDRTRNIRGLYRLLERVHGLKLELSTPLNMQLATEDLLLKAETALAV